MDFVVWLIFGLAFYGAFDLANKLSRLIKNKIKNNKERSKTLSVRENQEFCEDN